MPLIDAKCTSCGAVLQVDSERKEAFCSYCGAKYIVEKAVQNFFNFNTDKSVDEKIKAAHDLAVLGEFARSETLYSQLVDEAPMRWEVWYGLAQAVSHDLDAIWTRNCWKYLEKAIKVAPKEILLDFRKKLVSQRKDASPASNAYKEAREAALEKQRAIVLEKTETLNEQIDSMKEQVENTNKELGKHLVQYAEKNKELEDSFRRLNGADDAASWWLWVAVIAVGLLFFVGVIIRGLILASYADMPDPDPAYYLWGYIAPIALLIFTIFSWCMRHICSNKEKRLSKVYYEVKGVLTQIEEMINIEKEAIEKQKLYIINCEQQKNWWNQSLSSVLEDIKHNMRYEYSQNLACECWDEYIKLIDNKMH